MTAAEKAQRGQKIAALRAARVPWSTVASEVGLTVRGAEKALQAWQKTNPPEETRDHDRSLELIDILTASIHDLMRTAVNADQDSNKIGAWKAVAEHALRRWEVQRVAGLVPRNPAAPMIGQEVQLVFREFAELLRQHAIDDAIMQAFLEIAERRMGQSHVVEGRELPPPAAAA